MPELTRLPSIDAPDIHTLSIKDLRGVDFTSSVVSEKRSCYSLNMIRDTPGSVRKRMGYRTLRTYSAQINGIHFMGDELLIHSGTVLYKDSDQSVLYSGMANTRSWSLRFDGKLYLWDGAQYLVCGNTGSAGTLEVRTVESIAYVPRVTIGRAPNGGGQSYDAVNMLSKKRTDSFLGTAGATVYQLSFTNLDAEPVTAQVRNASGEWIDKAEGTDFSVNRTTGAVTFTSAPGTSPVEGEDNVRITCSVTNAEYQGRINKCRFSIAYGVEAASDRIFMSGNADRKNYIYYSQINDPTYMGDLWYCVLGQEHSPVTGFSIIDRQLAVHKLDDDNERNIFLIYGTLSEESDPEFRITNIIQGRGAISPFTFGYVKEPIFLTQLGIYATTPLEYNSERYVQNRSYFINKPLLEETALSDAHACVHKDFYLLAVGGKVYVLDSLVTTQDKTMRSNYYYEAFVWDNVPARVIYSNDNRLLFGDAQGKLYEFYSDAESISSYNDDGEAIEARWDIDFSGNHFYLKKRAKFISVRMAAAPATSVDIYCRVRGVWQLIGQSLAKARYLSFAQLTFSKFSFSSDTNPRTIGKKIKVKKVDAVRFSFRNKEKNEPFGIYELALEFAESGYYKR